MIPAGIHKYRSQVAYDRVFALLHKEKGNPLSVEEISSRLELPRDTVVHVIHNIQTSYDLCIQNGKVYFAQNKMRWYLAAFGLVICCTYFFCELIR